MEPELLAVGFAAGVVAGFLGVGGGVLFVPGLIAFTALGVVEAEATSLLAIIPTAIVGTWNQQRFGNVRLRDAGQLAAFAIGGTVAGVAIANAVPERGLELAFAGLTLYVAYKLVSTTLRPEDGRSPSPGTGPEPPPPR